MNGPIIIAMDNDITLPIAYALAQQIGVKVDPPSLEPNIDEDTHAAYNTDNSAGV
jgi:hypothetical protein